MGAAPRWLLAFALATPLLAQGGPPKREPQADAPSLTAELLNLERRLDASPQPPTNDRLKWIDEFLTRHANTPRAHEVLQATLWSGHLHLRRLDAAGAQRLFQGVVAAAEADSPLVAKARFGLHQALLLADRRDEARRTLQAIDATRLDPALADAVKVALIHIDSRVSLAIGQRLPDLQFGTDTRGRTVGAARFAAGPRLLVFWSLEHAPSQRRLEALANAWARSGQPATNLVAYALENDDLALQRMVDQRHWTFPILPARGQGYLHPDWVRLRVDAVPAMFLVDAEGRLLARDLTPDRLGELLQ